MADPRHRTVAVRVELLTHEPGHWCTACALPSNWLCWLAVSLGGRMHLQARLWCDECGTERDVPPGRESEV